MSNIRRSHELGLLRNLAGKLVKKPFEQGTFTERDLEKLKIAHTTLGPAGYVGLTIDGREALTALAEAMLSHRQHGERGVDFKAYQDELFKRLLNSAFRQHPSSLKEADVLSVEAEMTSWTDGRIPCATISTVRFTRATWQANVYRPLAIER